MRSSTTSSNATVNDEGLRRQPDYLQFSGRHRGTCDGAQVYLERRRALGTRLKVHGPATDGQRVEQMDAMKWAARRLEYADWPLFLEISPYGCDPWRAGNRESPKSLTSLACAFLIPLR
jgi:hypothetical protein